MESLTRLRVLALAGAVLALGALIVGAADGKKKGSKKGVKVSVVSSQQQQILNAGVVSVRVKSRGGRVVVDALQSGAATPVTGRKKVKRGKHTVNVPLSSSGRSTLGSCSVDGLRARFSAKRKKAKKSAGKTSPVQPLVKDLAACQASPPPPKGPKCDPLDPTVCLQPWPNDYFTRADPTTATGRRLDLQADQMPANTSGVHIDPTDIDRADGFSPGNLITLKIPQVSTQQAFNNTGFVPITDLHRYADTNQPVVVIDADTGERQPIFAELDPNPNLNQPGDTQDVNLIIRPTRNFTEGHRYIVALRNIRDASNNPVPAPESFRTFRDNLPSTDPDVEARRPHMEDVLSTLQSDGIPKANLYMAWDFTVASEHSLAGRALAIRDNALHQLGDDTPGDSSIDGSAPTFHITNVEDNPANLPANTLRQVDGEMTNIPCYLHPNCNPGGTFNFHPNGDVDSTPNGVADDNPTTTGVRFRCLIPNSAVTGSTVNPTQSGTFGHGLLGDYTQVSDMIKFTNSEANVSNTTWCATNWAGFSSDDIAKVISVLADVSKFPQLSDRMVQGFVNMIYLGRAMLNAGGFDTNAAFQLDPDGAGGNAPVPVLDPAQGLNWEGISQGAIMGGALTALEPDLTRSVLDVTGMNYSELLRRSSDSGQYLDTANIGLWAHYPSLQQRPLLLSLMQLLWDRGEANGYAEHMTTDPLPDTPAHNVLLQLAYGDHQVSNLAGETEARTIGADVETPALDPGRHWDVDPFLDIPAISSYPFNSSPGGSAALVYYDGGPLGFDGNQDCTDGTPPVTYHGTAPAPTVELPPNPTSVYGCDPHSYPRQSLDGVTQAASWLQPSGFIDQCMNSVPAPRPCYSNGYTGP
ncbi:MAG TPA: hypothetical protein VHU24_07795 [Solirubrobacterales bacterium]|nr:hypothetical protein [Solirubrobacterales bacterium]